MDKVDDEHADDGGGTEAEKRKRRQDRHRVLERKRREKTQGLLSEIHQEIERHTGRKQPGAAQFTLNKSLSHVVNHVRRVREANESPGIGVVGNMAALDVSGLASCEESVEQASQSTTVADSDAKVIEAAVKASPMPLAFVCMDGGIFDCNLAFSQMLGYPHNALLGNTIYMHAAPVDIAPLMSAVCELITGQQTQLRREVRFQHKDGHVIGRVLDMSGQRISTDKMYLVVHVLGEDVFCQSEQPYNTHISLDRPAMPAMMSRQGCAPQALAQSQPLTLAAPATALPLNGMRPILSVQTNANGHGENIGIRQGSMNGVVAESSGLSYMPGTLPMAASPMATTPMAASPMSSALHHQHHPQQLQQLQQLHYSTPPSPALHQERQPTNQQHLRQHRQLHQAAMHPHMSAAAGLPDELGFFGGEHSMTTLTGQGVPMMGILGRSMGLRENSGLGGLDLMDDSQGV